MDISVTTTIDIILGIISIAKYTDTIYNAWFNIILEMTMRYKSYGNREEIINKFPKITSLLQYPIYQMF